MPTLKNARHERFSQLLASGKCATDAYELAGYRRSHSNGPALARTEEINTRVAQINAERWEKEQATAAVAAERSAITRQSLIEKAEAVLAGAMEAGQFSAATAAIREIGVLSGKRIERSESGLPGEFEWLENLSVEELRRLADGKLDIASYCDDADRPDRAALN
jgi:hypothetical protein